MIRMERKRQSGEVAAPARTPDHDVHLLLTRQLELLLRLLADDGLVQQHVVQDASE